jgi:predicted RNase H-like HicB family nuclease
MGWLYHAREAGSKEQSRCSLRDYNVDKETMERITVESIPIVVGREEDGRWWADIESMPGVMAYGATRESAIAAVRALALRVAADCIDHGEEIPEPFTKVFSVA